MINKKIFRHSPKGLIINFIAGWGVETASGRSQPSPPAGGYEGSSDFGIKSFCRSIGASVIKDILM